MEWIKKKLKAFLDNEGKNFTQDKYIEMCEQLGKEPDMEEMPLLFEDFPLFVQESLHIYGKLGNRIVGEIGLIGKDYTNLETLFRVYEVESPKLAMEIITFIESREVQHSRENMKKEREKQKRSSSKKR